MVGQLCVGVGRRTAGFGWSPGKIRPSFECGGCDAINEMARGAPREVKGLCALWGELKPRGRFVSGLARNSNHGAAEWSWRPGFSRFTRAANPTQPPKLRSGLLLAAWPLSLLAGRIFFLLGLRRTGCAIWWSLGSILARQGR
jgi:hypothetical protein